MDLEKEMWKDVISYEGLYEVSSFGRVKSIRRRSLKDGRQVHERILKPGAGNRNYKVVCLSKNGISRTITIHRLVATSFIPDKEIETQVNHKDGNKFNNYLENLEWCTRKENMIHAKKVLKRNINAYALSHKEVFAVRNVDYKGITLTRVAKIYNVARSTISNIVNRVTYKNI